MGSGGLEYGAAEVTDHWCHWQWNEKGMRLIPNRRMQVCFFLAIPVLGIVGWFNRHETFRRS